MSAKSVTERLQRANRPESWDTTPRYAPAEVMTLRGVRPVLRSAFHPPESEEARRKSGIPIVASYGVLELVTDAGSRYYGVDRAYINSELRMVVIGVNKRDEVVSKWPVVPRRMR